MNERQIEKRLKREIEALGGLCLKWVSPGCSGVPDRIVLLPNGKTLFVELKTLLGALSLRQQYVIRSFQSCGHWPYVLYGAAEVDKFVEMCKREVMPNEI